MGHIFHKLYQERNNLFSILSTTVISTAASFCMMVAFANLVSPQVLGTYQYIISVVSIIGAFSLTGISAGIIRAIGKKDFFFLTTARRYLYLGSAPSVIIGLATALYYVARGNWWLAFSILLCVLIYAGLQISSRFSDLYMALNKVGFANYLAKAQALAPLFFVLPALIFVKDPQILAILFFGGTLFLFCLVLWFLKSHQTLHGLAKTASTNTEKIKRTRDYINFSFHQSIVTLIGAITANSDKIILFHILGPQQTAIYFIAVSIPNRLRSVIKNFTPFIFSRFARHSPEKVRAHMIKYFFVLLLGTLPAYVLYAFFTPLIFKLLLPQYQNAIFLSQVYAVTFFLSAIVIPDSALKAHGRTQDFYTINMIYGTVRPMLIIIGALTYGLLGATIAVIVGSLVHLLLVFYFAKNIKSHSY